MNFKIVVVLIIISLSVICVGSHRGRGGCGKRSSGKSRRGCTKSGGHRIQTCKGRTHHTQSCHHDDHDDCHHDHHHHHDDDYGYDYNYDDRSVRIRNQPQRTQAKISQRNQAAEQRDQRKNNITAKNNRISEDVTNKKQNGSLKANKNPKRRSRPNNVTPRRHPQSQAATKRKQPSIRKPPHQNFDDDDRFEDINGSDEDVFYWSIQTPTDPKDHDGDYITNDDRF